MNRRERRKAQRERMRLVKGGKADEAPTGIDLETPAGRFARQLDELVKRSTAADLKLEPHMVLAVLLRYGAAITVQLDQPNEDVVRALDVFIDQEREARQEDPDRTPTPGGAS